MAKQLLAFVALLILQGVALSGAAPKSSESTAFDEWVANFDPSTALASKLISCTGKTDGFYPGDDPDACTASYTACFFGAAYPTTCPKAGDVFDSSIEDCADRYLAKSAACFYYPAPDCSTAVLKEFLPIARCSDAFYLCETITGPPSIYKCNPGLTGGNSFDPELRVCAPKTPICDETPPATIPPTLPPLTAVPSYGCSGKTPGFAYALTECSTSFYTCSSTSASPTPESCGVIGQPGTVFDYTRPSGIPTAASCILRSSVPQCGSSFLGSLFEA